jgi:hypothetical protein
LLTWSDSSCAETLSAVATPDGPLFARSVGTTGPTTDRRR